MWKTVSNGWNLSFFYINSKWIFHVILLFFKQKALKGKTRFRFSLHPYCNCLHSSENSLSLLTFRKIFSTYLQQLMTICLIWHSALAILVSTRHFRESARNPTAVNNNAITSFLGGFPWQSISALATELQCEHSHPLKVTRQLHI